MKANSVDPDQVPQKVVSDPGLHCLPTSQKRDTRLIWIKRIRYLRNQNKCFINLFLIFCNHVLSKSKGFCESRRFQGVTGANVNVHQCTNHKCSC